MATGHDDRSPKGPVLGCIAGDVAQAVELASAVGETGLRTVVVTTGEPGATARTADAVVIALPSLPDGSAIEAYVQAALTLRGLGARQLFVPHRRGPGAGDDAAIGAVADALIDIAEQPIAVLIPRAVDADGVGHGVLYVGETAVSAPPPGPEPDAPVAVHVRTAVVDSPVLKAGTDAVEDSLVRSRMRGNRYVTDDSVVDSDVGAIAKAVSLHAVITGRATLAHAMAARAALARTDPARGPEPDALPGRRVVLSACATPSARAQVDHFARTAPVRRVDGGELARPDRSAIAAARWAHANDTARPVLIAVEAPEEEKAARATEAFFAALAPRLLTLGFGRIVVCGPAAAVAVTRGLGVEELVITTPVSPGVSWCVSSSPHLALALPRCGTGAVDALAHAHDVLDGPSSVDAAL